MILIILGVSLECYPQRGGRTRRPVRLPSLPVSTASRKKVYPKHVTGRFHSLRAVTSTCLQALLFLVPWLQWHGQQAVLLDLAGRRVFLFGQVIFPQETYFLHLMLITAAITLFASTALVGRVWCGYACPQTLFTQSFLMVERLIEGDRARRMLIDRGPWNREKIQKKLAKHSVWLGMALWLGFTFSGYFVPIRQLAADLLSGHVSSTTASIVTFFTAVSLFEFGWFREQFCNFLCPYARFQGAMMDRQSLIISYDPARGEPRGKVGSAPRGHCVDCSLCVQVCPQGIDIRKGLQLECIACAACIDVCDQVMDKVGHPRGLVRYSSLDQLEGLPRKSLLRPRVIAYAVIWTALVSTFLYLATHRPLVGLDVNRATPGGSTVYSVAADGRICNIYKLRLVNHTCDPQVVSLSLAAPQGGSLVSPAQLKQAELVSPSNPITLEPAQAFEGQFLVLFPRQGLPLCQTFQLRVDVGGQSYQRSTTFLYSGPR